MLQIFSLGFMLFLNFCNLVVGFETVFKDKNDVRSNADWHFSKVRPFHYFNSTNEIPLHFLPVDPTILPEGDGVWLIRYKDFSDLPPVFREHEDSTVSFIKYSAKHQLFNKISIKALLFGDAKLNVTNPMSMSTTIDPNPSNNVGVNKVLRWTTYSYDVNPSTQMEIQISINHPNSFAIVDNITILFPKLSKDI